MKVVSVPLMIKVLLVWQLGVFSSHAWMFPLTRQNMVQKAAVVATGISVAITSTVAPLPVDATSSDPFTGKYGDPKHPNCKREIVVSSSNQARVSGTDGTPGCPPDGSGKPWTLSGTVDGPTILVDFSPKGGPANLKGVYDTSDPEGIQWPDGNKWVKQGL